MRHDCPIKTVLAIAEFAATLGVAKLELVHAAGLDPAILADPDGYIAQVEEMRVWDHAVRMSGEQDFGLHLARWLVHLPVDHFDVLSFALRSSLTLREQYRLAGRYIRLVHESVYLSLEEEGDVARLVHGHSPEQIGPRHPVEAILATMLLRGREAIGDELVPHAVCFMHARPDRVSEHQRLFGAPVLYDCPRNELVLPRALLDRPQRHAEPRLLAILDRQLEGLLSGLGDNLGFVDEVQRRMMDELPERVPSVVTIAAKLHMSPRSLQRRLQRDGTSFAELLTDLRHDRARRYLQDPRITIGEVAFLLGFLDVTAFHRAFKRWTGMTPAEYRRSATSDPLTPSTRR